MTTDFPQPPDPSRPPNPYQEVADRLAANAPSTEEQKAKGLDGDMLDSLLRSRMIEGMRLGRNEGITELAPQLPQAFEEGRAYGESVGIAQGRESLVAVIRPMIAPLDEHLEHIRLTTGSTNVRTRAAEALKLMDTLAATLGSQG